MRNRLATRKRSCLVMAEALLRQFFGAEQPLALRALQATPATPEERAEIRRLLDIAETTP